MEIDSKNKYNLRSKGCCEEIALEALSPKKKIVKKSKQKFKVEKTKPKRTVDVNCILTPQKKKNDDKEEVVNTEKSDNIKIHLTKENTGGLAALALINSLVDSANKRMSKRHSKSATSNFLNDDLSSDSDDESYTFIENLDPEIEYTSEEEKYVKGLSKEKRDTIIDLENSLLYSNKHEVPLRFRILQSKLPLKAISLIINRLDHYYTLDPTDNEYGKLYPWVTTLDKIPFDVNIPVPISKDDAPLKIQNFLANTKSILDDAVYGHNTAKSQIISIIARQISNPNSLGNVIAIKGPMGNGKTTLIKEGICKAMKRPFALITLGGMSDASYLHGHEYTYEGARCGRIVEILTESKCMNPVIYFDELDKVSDTAKGEEIINALCHLTDPSQNTMFQDKYYSGVDFDLSKALFIFSYNNEENINPILLDRMYKIHTDGFSNQSKLTISKDYLLPKLLEEFDFNKGDVSLSDEALLNIMNNYCNNEKGVRNLKRNIETVISKLNVMKYLVPDNVETKNVTPPVKEETCEATPEVEETANVAEEDKKSNDSKLSDGSWVTESEETINDDEVLVNNPQDSISPWIEKNTDKTNNVESDIIKMTIQEKVREKITETLPVMELKEVDVKDVVDFTIKNFKIPYNLTTNDIPFFLKAEPINPSILHLYS